MNNRIEQQSIALEAAFAPTEVSIPEVLQSAIDSISVTEVKHFAQDMVARLVGITEILATKYSLPTEEIEHALLEWVQDATHGVAHSYWVYDKASELSQAEGANHVTDHSLLIRAVLHDMGEFLPAYELKGGEWNVAALDKKQKAEQHELLIAATVRRVAVLLGVDSGEARQLAFDIRKHDLFWSRPTADTLTVVRGRMSEAGRYFTDADRLVSNGESDPDQVAWKAIDRNRQGSLGKWYALRADLTAEDRLQWRTRTKGLFDGLSAVLREFLGPVEWLHTQAGREQHQAKKEAFLQQLIAYYTEQYRKGWDIMIKARELNWGLQEKEPLVRGPIHPKYNSFKLREMCEELMNKPVTEVKTSPEWNGRLYYGYSIQAITQDLETGQRTEAWLDPSILHFKSEEDLADALRVAVADYEQVLANEAHL